jgi:DNA-binding NtrC family response regulator
MADIRPWKILFIEDERSAFNTDTPLFDTLFEQADRSADKAGVLRLLNTNHYDMVIGDLSVEAEGAGLLKQIKDLKPEVTIFAMVSPKDNDKLFGIADLGINAFELAPEQFELALEEIARFNPYAKQ